MDVHRSFAPRRALLSLSVLVCWFASNLVGPGLLATVGAVQLAPPCSADSPERRGGLGCSIIKTQTLPADLRQPLFWHIDQFDSAAQATAAAGAAGVAFDAEEKHWLMTIESQTSDHHGGRHVAHVGPLMLPQADRYSMQVLSAAFSPGMYSLVHHHSGVEAWYMTQGEQCLETPTQALTVRAGETLAIPANVPMRLVATGSELRRALAVIVYDASRPPTMRMEEGAGPPLVPCK
jgi:quercetin dioxygenase-like cupin family protein